MDAGHEAAERALDEFEREAARLYEDAAKEAGEPIAEWLERFRDADEAMAALIEEGEATPDEYAQWRYLTFAAGKDEAIAETADRLTAANVAAMGILAGLLAPVFRENSDYAAWMVEREAGQIGFRLCDADHFNAIVEREDPLFARAEIDEGKDAAWNRKMITARVTAAVLSCKPIEDIERLSAGFASTNRGSASRIARTAVTGVQNAARVERFEQAEEMGIALKQEWLATVDNRTRHSHRELDGERAEVGKAFSNGLRYPGDPTGPGHEIWNCRCTLVAAVEGHTTEDGRRFTRYDGTYEEWKNGKQIASEDIVIGRSLGAAAFRDEVMLPDGTKSRISPNTRITGIKTIAGNGVRRKIDEVNGLVEKYGGNANEWEKKRGSGYVDDLGMSRPCELHWYEEPSVGRVKMKVSKFFYR